MPKSHVAEPVVDTISTPVAVIPEAEIKPVEPVVTEAKTSESGAFVAIVSEADLRRIESDRIVMRATYTSLGVGFIPVPVVDILAISGFQLKMIAELSELHGVKFSEHTARNVITALVGSLGPVVVGQLAARTMLKFVPGVGSAIASLWVQGFIDGAVTYGIGRVFQRHFEAGGTILDLDWKSAKEYFLVKYKEGKTIVSKSVSNATSAAAATFRTKEKVEPAAVVVVPA